MAAEQNVSMFLGESLVLVLKVINQDTGAGEDLTAYQAIEFQVKAADGNADPPLLSKALTGGITLRAQSGDTLGQAEIAILTADTTTNPNWPDAPGNVGSFRYDVVGIQTGGDRDVIIPPSDWVVKQVVNLP